MKKVLYSLLACILSLSFLTPFNIYANELYPHEDYENVFYDDDENYFDQYGNKLEGPWELMYMDYIPGDLSLVPDEPGSGGTSAASLNFELWNSNMVPIGQMTYTGNSKLLNSDGSNYKYIYMSCATGYKPGDKVSYDYTFEFYAGTNPLPNVTNVSVCGNTATYSISGNILNVNGMTNTISDDSEFYVIIELNPQSNGNFMVGSKTSATFSDYKEVDVNAQEQLAKLGEILNILQNIDANIEYGILDNIANINGNLITLSQNVNAHFNSLSGWIVQQTNDLKAQFNYQNGLIQTIADSIVREFNYLKNNITNNITTLSNNLNNWISDQTEGINNKLEDLLGSKNDYDNKKEDLSDTNNGLSNNVNDYNDLEQSFHEGMNESLNQIDLNVNLINGSDFINTATFISTNMNRIVNSNPYFNAFVITGLVLGIALVMIGKKVI